ncbi:MAG: glycosyltransferase family 1 protein [Rhodospirillaceae bacterium]|jgi:rhamnosyltransferase subunit B|nr:glycosyltransferase family 1 protein [Rhodospirillaceae bacterium]MBT3495097.1 glycosyltransferase family 1 protein [Rhodospirillaceae bacterium]MBT3782794.1 glycosyltransferase family 1 protein [Rhodospirillaceae bacterium]MBT4171115.1 glycosyltransferase family 1 protein [Rhodospirillaceae bacterium]MBT4561527.1 glycosyltransferase family 1 protein [Rhodospirillaceae bacterium]
MTRTPVLLSCVGTMGDLMPVLATGRLLIGAGHEVEIMANEVFRSAIEASGIAFHAIGGRAEFDAFVGGAAWQDRDSGWAAFLREGIRPCLAPAARRVEEFAALHKDRCLIVPNNYSYGARWAARAHGLPLVNLAIQPGMLRGMEPSQQLGKDLLPGEKVSYWRAMRAAEDYLFHTYGRTGGGPTAGLGHLFQDGGPNKSDENFIGLFPYWFERPGDDWPAHLHLSGFPLIDIGIVVPLAPEVEAFLKAGAPPVALFCGSFMQEATLFFQRGLDACRANGRRSLIISRYPEDLPADLPDDCLVVAQAPFSQLLPHFCAIIHHGGIGTIAQSMAAGLPQLVIPLRFEQPDNAACMQRLGAGRVVPLANSDQATEVFSDILVDPEIQNARIGLADRMANNNPFHKTAEILRKAVPNNRS